jgi:hypothetical protein
LSAIRLLCTVASHVLCVLWGSDAMCLEPQVTQKNMGGGGDGAKGAGRDGIMDLLVMENIFYGRATTRIYDLKVRALTPAPVGSVQQRPSTSCIMSAVRRQDV